MQFKTLTLVALSAVAASAQLDSVALSVLSVLKTAIPAELIASAGADPAAFSAELASSIAAGETPPWYVALPTEVKSYLPLLYPAPTPAATTASETPSSTAYTAPISAPPSTTPAPISVTSYTVSISGSTAIPGNSTAIGYVSPATLKPTGGANSDAPITVSTSGASRMTVAIGAGLAGAFGLVGMLAL
ncbi:hypothetical protein K504DRAFT_62038 [Pleomassaria siparia CBS 279.74]|uniref:Uncharacterized protein n=1 Tax=Pleomassaria siparia CBS 279.74 TaxID=1314801 RepID=A0A6G1K1C6_9PLEO|nr:hypothetical protein K504DRAFT_62038 [Pleomassaria siparia CBS 279.74]